MKSMKRTILNCIFVLLLGVIGTTTVTAQVTELTIVGNLESVPSEMTMNLLKSVFRGEKLRWVDGSKVKLALMKTNTPLGLATSEKLLNMSANELNKYYLALVFQGKIKAPSFFNSVSDLEEYVGQTPGAIGVVQSTTNELLKIVLVDGNKQF